MFDPKPRSDGPGLMPRAFDAEAVETGVVTLDEGLHVLPTVAFETSKLSAKALNYAARSRSSCTTVSQI